MQGKDHDPVADMLAKAGIGAESFSVQFEQDLQEDIVTISAGRLSEEQLAFIRDNSAYLTIVFTDPKNADWWRETKAAEVRAFGKVRAAELRQRLLALPVFDPCSEKLETFVQKIEHYCGLEPGAAKLTDDGRTVLVRGTNLVIGQVTVLMDALTAALEEHDIRIMVIAEEARE
jgi:hypothetical protein